MVSEWRLWRVSRWDTVIGMVFLLPLALQGQESVSIDALLGVSSEELETAQTKLTYLGPGEKSVPPVVFTVEGHSVDWEAFRPWIRANDLVYQRATERSFTVQRDELRAMLEDLRSVVSGHPPGQGPPILSVTIVAGPRGRRKGSEARLHRRAAEEFFIHLRGALRADPKDITLMEGQANIDAMRELQWFGCALDLLPKDIPAREVTAQVRVTRGGFRWNARTKGFDSTVTLTNVSRQPIRGPIALVVDLSTNARLRNAHGTTCVTTPVGREFINLPMPAELLQPGEALEVVLEFKHEEGSEISFSTKVLGGPGER